MQPSSGPATHCQSTQPMQAMWEGTGGGQQIIWWPEVGTSTGKKQSGGSQKMFQVSHLMG